MMYTINTDENTYMIPISSKIDNQIEEYRTFSPYTVLKNNSKYCQNWFSRNIYTWYTYIIFIHSLSWELFINMVWDEYLSYKMSSLGAHICKQKKNRVSRPIWNCVVYPEKLTNNFYKSTRKSFQNQQKELAQYSYYSYVDMSECILIQFIKQLSNWIIISNAHCQIIETVWGLRKAAATKMIPGGKRLNVDIFKSEFLSCKKFPFFYTLHIRNTYLIYVPHAVY